MSQSVSVREYKSQTTEFGFWVYLMTDCIMFATLFATYAVLRNNTAGGPGASELFSMPYVLVETVILLVSSLTAGMSLLLYRAGMVRAAVMSLVATLLLGAAFLSLELHEFAQLVSEGYSWQANAFLSAFFTLVGTHGLHIFFGIIWGVLMLWLMLRAPGSEHTTRKLRLFTMFWHFLDVVWIFIFSIVYLLGGIGA